MFGLASLRPLSSHRAHADEPTLELELLGALIRGPAHVVAEATRLTEVRRLLVEQRVPAIAVAGPAGTITGIVTRTDVLRTSDPDATAADAMSGFVFALSTSASVDKAAALMAYEGVGQVLVVGRDGALLGMVSAVDIARYYAVRAGYLRR